jgi:hypothetical protein
MKRRILFLTALLLFAASAVAQDVPVKASVSQSTVGLQEQVEYNIEISSQAESQVQPPPFEGFRVLGPPSQGTQFSMINGQTSYTKTITYVLIPQKEGTLTIAPATVRIGGKSYATQPVKVTVTKNASAQAGGSEAGSISSKEIFITATADKKKLYFGEGAVVTYKLYFTARITRYQAVQDAKSEGFWIEKFDYDKQQQLKTTREVINGQVYQVAIINKIEVFPSKTGELEISPYQANCEVMMTSVKGKKAYDPFHDFDDFFGRLGKTVAQDFTSPAIKFQVDPLPIEGRPASFTNAVGKYDFIASVDKKAVKVGDAITLKLVVSGNGNVNTLTEPDLKIPQSFEKYDPKVTKTIDKSTGIVLGKKVSEFVLIPRASGKFEIPPIEFSAFNPQTKKYEVTKSDPFEITVEPSAAGLANVESGNLAGGGPKRDIEKFGDDIRFIKTDAATLTKAGGKFYTHPVFLAALVLPLLALGFASVKERRDAKVRGNVEYARLRQASPEAKKRLKLAKQYLKDGKEKEFYGEIETAIIKFIGNKFNTDDLAMTKPEVRSFLESKNLPAESVNRCMSILEKSEFYRFAPKQSAAGQMQQLYDDAVQSISEIAKL